MKSGYRLVNKTLSLLALCVCAMSFASVTAAQEVNQYTPHYIKHGPNHLSVIIGGTESDEDGTEFTIGLDYEYRVNELIGLGGVVEYATGDYDATTLLGVADIHISTLR